MSERGAMVEYWMELSQEASVENMMLDSDARELTKHDLPEILSYLPSCIDKDIVELGAGIGRFTGYLAEHGRTVVAVDFIKNFIKKNQQTNSKYSNIQFLCDDVTKLQLDSNSYDIIFSNWLMMYLEDQEVHHLMREALTWLREGGYFFARESCFKPVGNICGTSLKNPTKYRRPTEYLDMFTKVTAPTETADELFGFELVLTKPLQSYIKLKQNDSQYIWLLEKRRRPVDPEFRTMSQFLDTCPYNLSSILQYEVFGRSFLCHGGLKRTKEFVSRLDLQPGQLVLDVGCGIGGSAFYMVKNFGVKVVAIDLSSNMIELARQRARDAGISDDEIQFEQADASRREYSREMFDVIYSRETILHIHDKPTLFRRFFDWLKKGGKLFITDYCCGNDEHSGLLDAYKRQFDYTFVSLDTYTQMLREAGFTDVTMEDKTSLYGHCLKAELTNLENIEQDFIKEFSKDDLKRTTELWRGKISRINEQRWGVFYTVKH